MASKYGKSSELDDTAWIFKVCKGPCGPQLPDVGRRYPLADGPSGHSELHTCILEVNMQITTRSEACSA